MNRNSTPETIVNTSHTLEMRVAVTICEGAGWIRPVILRADWPLGKLNVTRDGVELSTLLLSLFRSYAIPWSEVTQITMGWLQVGIKYQQLGVDYEMTLCGLFLQSRLRNYLHENQISVSVQ